MLNMKKTSLSMFLILFSLGFTAGILIYQYYFLKQFPLGILQIPLQTAEISNKNGENSFPPSKEGALKKVEIDLFQQKMILLEDGEIIKEIQVSTGKKETPTPTGKFRVINKSQMIYSKLAGCWLPFWVGFSSNGEYGFHELPICNNERIGINEIGKAASLGCVRLNIGDAENFYNWVDVETKVEIYNQAP